MYAPLLAAILAAAAPANDKEKPPPAPKLESNGYFSMPFLFGGDVAYTTPTSSGFFWGWRPELIAAWREHLPAGSGAPLAVGVGAYGEIVGSTGTSQIFLGAGATVVGYFGRVGLAASAGLDIDWFHATPYTSPVLGAFVGYRTAENGGLDTPFGLRIDVRPALGVLPTTVIISAQLDVIMALGEVLLFAMMGRGFD